MSTTDASEEPSRGVPTPTPATESAAAEEGERTGAYSWNAGGWLGSQIGCTLWMALLGFVLIPKDLVSAAACLLTCAGLNVYGALLWRSRQRLTADTAIIRFLGACTVSFLGLAVLVNARSDPTAAGDGLYGPTDLPYWVALVPLSLLIIFQLRIREAKRARSDDGASAPNESQAER